MGQRKTSKGLDSLSRATDILSTLLAQQVRELNARQRENRRSGAEDPGTMKGLKEATAVLKDLAAAIAEVSGTKVVFELPDDVEKAGYSTATKARLDGSKLKQLGWTMEYDVKSGIGRTIEILKG